MGDITITWPGGERTFTDERPVRVGRAASCDVLVLDERVSRDPHLELRHEGGVWILEDRSSGGTWSNGQRVDRVSVPARHAFHLGAPDGPELILAPHPLEAVAASAAAGAATTPAAAVAPPDGAGDPGEALLAEAAALTGDPAAPVTPAAPAAPAPATPATPAAPAPGGPRGGTAAPAPPGGGHAGPPAGGVPRFDPTSTVSLDDRALRLSHGDSKLVVPPGYVITIGRDPSCDLVIDNQIVSRQHARFAHDGVAWVLQDLGSTRGTFVDGRRLRGGYRAEGVFEVSLGDDTAGEKVRVVTAGEHHEPRNRLPVLLALAAFVVALAGVAAAIALSDDDDDPTVTPATAGPAPTARPQGDLIGGANTAEQLATVKASTVLIQAVDEDGFPLWIGSGTVITEEGHILTNAHVADPPAESLDALVPLLGGLEDRSPAAGFVIFVSPSEDAAAEPRFLAELVASSDTQDASIIQITEDLDGDRVRTVPIEPIPIGTSSTLRAGAAIHSLGYPANSTTNSISVRLGDVVSFVSGDEFEEFVGGDDRRVMNTTAVLGQGSSGGPIVRAGKIVGLNATLNTGDGLDRGWAVPIDEIAELLDEVGLAPASD